MIEAYRAYELGAKSAERLSKALNNILCCPGDKECNDTVARLAPWLAGVPDCAALEDALEVYLAWLSLRWAYRPCGEPPSAKKRLVLMVLCNSKQPVPEDVFREALGEPGEGEGLGE